MANEIVCCCCDRSPSGKTDPANIFDDWMSHDGTQAIDLDDEEEIELEDVEETCDRVTVEETVEETVSVEIFESVAENDASEESDVENDVETYVEENDVEENDAEENDVETDVHGHDTIDHRMNVDDYVKKIGGCYKK